MSMDVDWGAVGSGALSGASAGATIGNLFGPVGAGIGAGAGALIGGISGYFDSSHATEQQLDTEERAIDEWTRQQDALNAEYDRRVADERRYNDPSAQAARLKAAGINPLSSMTNGGAVASNTAGNTGTPSAQVPFKSAMGDIIAVQQLRNSTALTESQIALNMANANKIDDDNARAGEFHIEQIIGIRLANDISRIDAMIKGATANYEISLSAEKLAQVREVNKKLKEEREYLIKQGKIADKELDVMDAKIAEYESIVALNDSEVQFNNAQIKHWAEQLAFDKQVEERVKAQGLAALRQESARIAIEKDKLEWTQAVDQIELSLKDEGMSKSWSDVGTDVLQIIFSVVTMVALKKIPAKAGAQAIKSLVKRGQTYVMK